MTIKIIVNHFITMDGFYDSENGSLDEVFAQRRSGYRSMEGVEPLSRIDDTSKTELEKERRTMFDEMIDHMRTTLAPNDRESTKSAVTLFRRRSEHSIRVLGWVEKLAREFPDIDLESLKIAAIFHDVGYATCTDKKEHAAESAKICESYLTRINYDPARKKRIVGYVGNHSQKSLLGNNETPIELKVLMEADILDETGAQGILWDCMVQGQRPEQSYVDTYRHIVRFSAQTMKSNPLYSTMGRQIWEEKRRLVELFVQNLEGDLFIDPTVGAQ